MPKKRITKLDPREELSPYLNHEKKRQQTRPKRGKPSLSLHGLHRERKRSLWRRLGTIIALSGLAIVALGYYVSPLADVGSVTVHGASDLPVKEIVARSGIKASDKVLTYSWGQSRKQEQLAKSYPEIRNTHFHVAKINNLVIEIKEYPPIAYLKEGNQYRKILANGKVGSQTLTRDAIKSDKPLFVGYNRRLAFKNDLRLFNSLPAAFRQQVKLLSGHRVRRKQIVLVMKDNNVVIGNVATLKNKVRYYHMIQEKAGKDSLIDLEVGAYSRPLTRNEKKSYGIS